MPKPSLRRAPAPRRVSRVARRTDDSRRETTPVTYPGPLAARRPHVPVPGHLVFQVLGGSRAYGLARAGADEDWRGVYQASAESLYGLAGPIDHVEFPPDQQYWELTHFGRLCLAGNPHALELLWIPPEMIALDSGVARALRAMRRDFLTASTVSSYFGFLFSIRRSMAPTKVKIAGQDQTALPSDRQDKLLAGKRGSHLVRIFLNFRELLRSGEMRVRLEGEDLKLVSAIKAGVVPADRVLSLADGLERECRSLAESHPWPAADSRSLEKLLIRARRGEL